MGVVSHRYLRNIILLLSINGGLYAQSTVAVEWQGDFEPKSGYSGYTSTSDFSKYRNSDAEKPWSNGRSFNDENKVRYSAATSKNPWKPVNSPYYKKSFGDQRPWGNVPDRKRPNKNSMKFYDQRFKQWSHQRNIAGYNSASAIPFAPLGRSPIPPANLYGQPGSIYSSPFTAPLIHPGMILNPAGYGGYAGRSYPNAGLLSGPWLW